MKAVGIPTVHAGVHFRSKLEARWAIVFDALGWPWEYEPAIPLSGYIPDFLVRVALHRPVFSRPVTSPLVLMEAKPIVNSDDYVEPVRKIALSSWEHAAVVLCPTLWRVDGAIAFGLGTDRVERRDALTGGHNAWHPVGVAEDGGLQFGGGRDITEIWRKAGNTVQWCPKVPK